jgi:hypothetical protein
MNKLLNKIQSLHVLGKRQKIILTSVILSLGLLYTLLVPIFTVDTFILQLCGLSYLLSLWALWTGINRVKAVVLFILPVMFTFAIAKYYFFLLPVTWVTRIPFTALYGLSFYLLLLMQNIFNVSSIRTIPLFRVASTTNFIATLVTFFALTIVIFNQEQSFYINALLVFVIRLVLIIQNLWTTEMEESLTPHILIRSVILALIMGEIALVLSFWPISKPFVLPPVAASTLVATMYIALGVVNHDLRERLSKEVAKEFAFWGGSAILIIIFLSLNSYS